VDLLASGRARLRRVDGFTAAVCLQLAKDKEIGRS
jgi:hypothetical protein